MTARQETDYGLLLTRVLLALFTVALILLIAHATKPPERTATEQAAIAWGQEHLRTKRVYALCEGSACMVWGVRSWIHSHNAATPAIPLDCSAHPCMMVIP